MKDKNENKRSFDFILYGLLWILLMLIVSNIAYQEHISGDATLYTAFEGLEHFKIFYWLNPVTWGKCLKYSFFYWLGIAIFLIYEKKWEHDAAGREAGSAKWNDKVEEYNKTHTEPFGNASFSDEPGQSEENLNNKEIPPVPGNPNMIMSESVRLSTADMKTHVNNNVLVVGGAGSGKSRFFIKPNVMQMNCSYVVTDPSGELLRSMHDMLVENGYDIKVFNLVDMTHSCKYNPFNYIRNDTDVSILVDCFMSNTVAPDQKSGDPFWDKSEKAMLSALIFYLVDIADPEFRKFSTILWLVQLAQMDEDGGGRGNDKKQEKRFNFSVDNPLDELFNGTKKIIKKTVKDKDGKLQTVLEAVDITDKKEIEQTQEKIETSLCLTNYKTFKLGGTKTLKSILISAAVRLNPFSLPTIQNLTDDDNVHLEEVGDRLTCFFAIIPQTNSTFNFLISMLFSQMFESLYYKGSTIPNSRLNYHVRFLLDEFANIGKIPEFPQKISTCRKYNISTTIVLQSIAQIKMLYKDDYETIIGNCDTAICLGTNEQTTADYFSKKLGKGTIRQKSKSMQIGKSGGNISIGPTGRELMTADEIMTMPYTECLVMMNHVAPFKDNKYPLENHPQYINKKTGDACDERLYHLEDDESFLCIPSNMVDVSESNAAENVLSEDAQEKYMPNSLTEVLGDLLVNIPDEDGYYLVKDVDPNVKKSLMTIAREKASAAIRASIDDGFKTAFFDGDNMDINFLRPITTRMMNEYGDEINDILIACNSITIGHKLEIGAKDKDCNIMQAITKMKQPFSKESSNDMFSVYKSEVASEEKFGKLKDACKGGHQTVISNRYQEDEDDNVNENTDDDEEYLW